MGKIVHLPAVKGLPVFKIKATLEIWKIDDPERVPMIIAIEQVGLTAANQSDLKAMAKSVIFGRLAHFGVDVLTLDCQFETVEFFAAQSRTYAVSILEVEPAWVPASDDLDTKKEAIENLTYLPYDIQEQQEVYGNF